jgi:hypothetical protein
VDEHIRAKKTCALEVLTSDDPENASAVTDVVLSDGVLQLVQLLGRGNVGLQSSPHHRAPLD